MLLQELLRQFLPVTVQQYMLMREMAEAEAVAPAAKRVVETQRLFLLQVE
jgi:hypothetical protein